MSLTSLNVLLGIMTFAILSAALPQIGKRTSSSGCLTVGGDDNGASCVFPFIFKDKVYNGCTLVGADDGKPWCSTKVDSQGVHVSGEGKWGHCGQECELVDGTCYEDDSSLLLDAQHDSSTNTPDECKMTCSSRGYSYAGVQYGYHCFCGNEKPHTSLIRDSAQCDTNCPGDVSQKCGGNWRMTIYNTGCFKEDKIDYYGNDIKGEIVVGVDACANLCGETAACKFWSFVKSDKTCWIKTSNSDKRGNFDRVSGTRSCATGKIRKRKNVKNLSQQEIQRLEAALNKAIESSKFKTMGNIHGYPTNICPNKPEGICCPHRTEKFLPWHRLYMVQMEEMLGEALPYWDWTEDGTKPTLWHDVEAPINTFSGSQSRGCSGDANFARRDPSRMLSTSQVEGLRRQTELAFKKETFEEFSTQIEGPHNLLHVAVGCDMGSFRTAGYDPIFYLHHSNVDRLFAFWQELQRLRGHRQGITFRGQSEAQEPFNKKEFTFTNKQKILQRNKGQDAFDYKSNYDYEFDDLTFKGMTAGEFLRANPTSTSSSLFEGKPVLDENSFFRLRFYIGVVLPKMAPSGFYTFDLCQGERCSEAGEVATFGIDSNPIQSILPVDQETYRVIEYDVTHLVTKSRFIAACTEPNRRSNIGYLSARLTSSVVHGLPEPVIIYSSALEPSRGIVAMAAEQEPRDYGNLLAKYNVRNDYNHCTM